jgi:hypothetical protein
MTSANAKDISLSRLHFGKLNEAIICTLPERPL